MLQALRGRVHQVLSAVTVLDVAGGRYVQSLDEADSDPVWFWRHAAALDRVRPERRRASRPASWRPAARLALEAMGIALVNEHKLGAVNRTEAVGPVGAGACFGGGRPPSCPPLAYQVEPRIPP